jgi:TonB family protein
MSSETKYKTLFSPSGCLTLEAMNRYQASELTESEKREIDDHLNGCELCCDALEGLRLITDRDKLNSIVSEINKNLRKNLITETGTVNPIYQESGMKYLYFAVAASVLLLIAVFSYLNFYSPIKETQLSVLSPADYEIQIPDLPVPKLPKQQSQESAIKLSEQIPADEIKQTSVNQQKPGKVKSGSDEKSENFKPAIAELKSSDTLLTETYANGENITVLTENKESEPTNVAIASTQPVEYYLGGVIIEAENSGIVLSDMSISNKSAETMTNNGLTSESGKRKNINSERPANKRKNEEKTNNNKVLDEINEKAQPSNVNSENISHFFRTIDTMPVFPGGDVARTEFLKKHLQYPQAARIQGFEGTIYISFIVEETGKITSVEIQKGLEEECNRAAVRAVQSMPDWQPGYFEGKAIRVRFTMPITFQLK